MVRTSREQRQRPFRLQSVRLLELRPGSLESCIFHIFFRRKGEHDTRASRPGSKNMGEGERKGIGNSNPQTYSAFRIYFFLFEFEIDSPFFTFYGRNRRFAHNPPRHPVLQQHIQPPVFFVNKTT